MEQLESAYQKLVSESNEPLKESNGIYQRYKNPVLTAQHTPLFWRYDFNRDTNPHLMERFGINAVLNAGAIKFNDKYVIIIGTFNANHKGHMGMFAGTLDDIIRLDLWDLER